MAFKLLLIDDDEIDRQSIIRSLNKNNFVFEIWQSSTAQAGLELAAQKLPDAILLDVNLPDRSGLEVLQVLRSGEMRSSAVIMISHEENDAVINKCMELGAQDFLLKGEVTGRHLVRAVRQAKQRFEIEQALRDSNDQLRLLSEHDTLTGLANRRHFEASLEKEFARVRRGHHLGIGILLLDLDDFKSINDTLGHDVGDQLLIQVALRLKNLVRKSDLVCRLGGDEFVILVVDLPINDSSLDLANRIIESFQRPFTLGDTERKITTSIGISVSEADSEHCHQPIDLLKCADVAMYKAKQEGRNQYRFYSTILQQAVVFQSQLKLDLFPAIERGEFKTYYQAQIEPVTGQLTGIEVLIRWHHPELGILMPAQFMNMAEKSKAIVPIGFWTLRDACRQLKQWQKQQLIAYPGLRIALNLSAVQVMDERVVASIEQILQEAALPATVLELEITEKTLFEDPAGAGFTLARLAELGITLALDDFGTGYSSLQHLKLFPIQVLKIDKDFIATIGDSLHDEQLLLAMLAFAKALDLKVIAEGVETQAQAEFCTDHGFDLLQGYYYSIPALAKDFEKYILRKSIH